MPDNPKDYSLLKAALITVGVTVAVVLGVIIVATVTDDSDDADAPVTTVGPPLTTITTTIPERTPGSKETINTTPKTPIDPIPLPNGEAQEFQETRTTIPFTQDNTSLMYSCLDGGGIIVRTGNWAVSCVDGDDAIITGRVKPSEFVRIDLCVEPGIYCSAYAAEGSSLAEQFDPLQPPTTYEPAATLPATDWTPETCLANGGGWYDPDTTDDVPGDCVLD